MKMINYKIEDNENIFSKKNNKLEKIGIISLLKFWDKNTWLIWKSKLIIRELINQKDFSTLFTLKKENMLSEKEESKLNKQINHVLLDRKYSDKLSIFKMMKNHNIEIKNENIYNFMISNYYFIITEQLKDIRFNISDEEKNILNEIKEKLKDKDFVLGLKKFVINDIKNSPQTFGAGLNWAMNRDAYYEPRKANYLFAEMTKKELLQIINYDIGSTGVKNEYSALLNNAPIDYEVLNDLGFNTEDLINKAQNEIVLKKSEIDIKFKQRIDNILEKVKKIKVKNNQIYEIELELLINNTLPNIIRKYLSIDIEYRNSLKNIEGKTPEELFSDALYNIDIKVSEIDLKMNEEKVKELSIENRKLKI